MNHLGDTNKMISDTPRTDEAQFGTGRVSVDFARQLERELNAANDMFRKLNIHALNLVDRIKRLEEAGDALCAAAAFMGWHMEIEKWNKAKEAKL